MKPDHSLLLPPVPENPKIVHTKDSAIRAEQSLAIGQRHVKFQDPVGNRRLVMDHDMQNAFVSALLDELEDLGTNVNDQHRRLRTRQYSAIPQIEN